MSSTMIKHQANRAFFAYWNRLRAGQSAPEQRLMDPALIGEALPDIFIVDVSDDGAYEIRLAGTRLCAFWGRELRGEDALSLWQGQDREGAEMLLFSVLEDGAVAIATQEVTSGRGERLEMEMVDMPLVRHVGGRTVRRIIGAFVPFSCPYWMGADPIARQTIVSVRMVWPEIGEVPEAIAPARGPGRIASALARPVPGGAPAGPGDMPAALHGMPVLSRRAHLTLLRGGGEAGEDG